jgi:dihydroflavonol-4-reductase
VWSVNYDGTRVVASACRRAGTRMVHCSSHAALEREPIDRPLDEGRPLALTISCPYHRAKAHAERYVLSRVDDGLEAVVVSPGTMIGPHDYEPSMIGTAMLDIYKGNLPLIIDAVSDYVDTRDVAAAIVAAASRGRVGERYLLTGDVYDMRGFGQLLTAATGRPTPRVCLPLWAAWGLVPLSSLHSAITGTGTAFTPGMLRAAISNDVVLHDKAARELGFAPRPAGDSVADSFAWFDEQGWL